jgi:16S rRNA (guanine1516-N2)-methyltransferase
MVFFQNYHPMTPTSHDVHDVPDVQEAPAAAERRARVYVLPGDPRSGRSQLQARTLAEHLSLTVIDDERAVPEGDLVLRCLRTGLELASPGESRHGVRADFADLDLRPGSRSLSRRQPLPRALGRDSRTVLDATLGLGRDCVLIAAFGYTVIACERMPVVAALVDDALRHPNCPVNAEIRARITLDPRDAREVISQTQHGLPALPALHASHAKHSIDVVYIDPMFPPKKKASALPKKRIRILRSLVGDDDDAAALLETARAHVRRVVVKRADDAPELAPTPTMSFKGKSTRYDVYIRA